MKNACSYMPVCDRARVTLSALAMCLRADGSHEFISAGFLEEVLLTANLTVDNRQ